MTLDVVDLREFYLNPLGRAAERILRARLARLWPDVRGETVLALGYATPLLRPWLGQARTLLAMMPAGQGVSYWPREGPNIVSLADMTALPLPDESVNRVVLLHALETAVNPEALLREIWRVLKGNGRALVIVPNRHGLWTHFDSTPFGTGRPYSTGQLKESMRDQGFLIDRTAQALFMLPSQARLALAMASAIEQTASWLFPAFGGVLIMEANKQIYAPLMTKSRVVRRPLVLPLPFPITPKPVGAN